jgi:maltose O-acetyltransferase
MTEQEKMLAGELYRSTDPELQSLLARAQQTLRLLNSIPNEDWDERFMVLQELFADLGPGTQIKSPFMCDYGKQIRIGRNGFVNYDCVFLDCNVITIGDDVQIAPGVHIYTAYHPLDPETRRSSLELAKPVTIGNNVWLGGKSVVCAGVNIGDNSIIGAGSVVVKDVPANCVAAGNPCRVIRRLTPHKPAATGSASHEPM